MKVAVRSLTRQAGTVGAVPSALVALAAKSANGNNSATSRATGRTIPALARGNGRLAYHRGMSLYSSEPEAPPYEPPQYTEAGFRVLPAEPAPAQPRSLGRRVWGMLVAAGAFLLKFGAVLYKLKVVTVAGSMIVSIGAYALARRLVVRRRARRPDLRARDGARARTARDKACPRPPPCSSPSWAP